MQGEPLDFAIPAVTIAFVAYYIWAHLRKERGKWLQMDMAALFAGAAALALIALYYSAKAMNACALSASLAAIGFLAGLLYFVKRLERVEASERERKTDKLIVGIVIAENTALALLAIAAVIAKTGFARLNAIAQIALAATAANLMVAFAEKAFNGYWLGKK